MSRIAEALKRAKQTSGDSRDLVPAGLEPTGPAPDRSPDDAGIQLVFQPVDPAIQMAEKLDPAAGDDALPIWGEQYRRLAAALHHAQDMRGYKTAMVTSALPAEGKSLTSVNLALTLSRSYRRRVLLVDGDTRKPSLHEIFRVPNLTGFRDGLDDEANFDLPVFQLSSMLYFMPAGPPMAETVGITHSNRVRAFLREASLQFDWVIVDTPPAVVVPEAGLLADMVDGVLLVVEAGRSPFQAVQEAVETVGSDRILGVVLNRARERSRDYRYGYGYGYGYGTKDPNPRGVIDRSISN